MGSSMGGAISLLYAGTTPFIPASIVVLAAPLDLKGLLVTGDASLLPDEGFSSFEGFDIRNAFFKEVFPSILSARCAPLPVLYDYSWKAGPRGAFQQRP
jgi:pimeloyl-ACP methyl ester carboxylesterase